MLSLCGADCCEECSRREACGGCQKTAGHPFGGTCIAAEEIKRGGPERLLRLKEALISEFNALGIEGLAVDDLHLLNGFFINLEYPLANGQKRTTTCIWGIRSSGPAATGATGWLPTAPICWCANTGAMGKIRRLSCIKSGRAIDAAGSAGFPASAKKTS